MNLFRGVLKYWLKSLGFFAAIFLLAGCGTGELLVKKEEVVPIKNLKVDFVQVMPKGDGSSSYVDISRELDKGGYYNGTLGYRLEVAVSDGLSESGVDAASSGKLSHIIGNVSYSHALAIVPKSFSSQYRYSILQWVSINAEYQLYDLESKKIVWKSMVMIPVTSGEYSKLFAKDILLSWDKYGFIKLEKSALQQLKYGPPGK